MASVDLKTDIFNAFIKNITPDQEEDFQMDGAGKKKVDLLAEELAKAIVDFITAQTFRVDNLDITSKIGNAKTDVGFSKASTILPTTPTAPGAPGAPHKVPSLDVKSLILQEFKVGVDKDGSNNTNSSGNGKDESDASEVRLRTNEVVKSGL